MGFEHDEFHGEIDENFDCSICLDVMQNPKMIKCEHLFCDACIRQVLKEHARCPLDRTPFGESDIRKPFIFFTSVYETLKKKCPFWPECEAEVLIKDSESHSASCDYNPMNNVHCDNRKFFLSILYYLLTYYSFALSCL